MFQFCGARFDPLFKLVARALKLRVALLDLVEHPVKAVDKRAQFIVLFFDSTNRVIVSVSDGFSRLHQMENRTRNNPLQRVRQQQSNQGGRSEQKRNDRSVISVSRRKRREVGFQADRPDPLAPVNDRLNEEQMICCKFNGLLQEILWRNAWRGRTARVNGNDTPVSVAKPGRHDIRFGAQGGEHFFGAGSILKLKRGRAVVPDHFRHGG